MVPRDADYDEILASTLDGARSVDDAHEKNAEHLEELDRNAINPAFREPCCHVLRETYDVSWFFQCCLRFDPVVSLTVVRFIILKNVSTKFTLELTIAHFRGAQ